MCGVPLSTENWEKRIGLVINDLPTVESKSPSQFGGVLLASARHAPLAPDKGYNTHDTLSLVYTAASALSSEQALLALPVHLRLASLSRCHSRAIGVLFCRAFLFVRPRLLGGPETVPGRDDRCRLRLGAGIESRRLPGARLALPPSFPVWGVGPAAPRDLRRDRGHPRVGGGAAPLDRVLTP